MAVSDEDLQRIQLLEQRLEVIRSALAVAELREDVRVLLEQHLETAGAELAEARRLTAA